MAFVSSAPAPAPAQRAPATNVNTSQRVSKRPTPIAMPSQRSILVMKAQAVASSQMAPMSPMSPSRRSQKQNIDPFVSLDVIQVSPTKVVEKKKEEVAPVQNENWQVELLYDGKCHLCSAQSNFLMKRDAGRGIIKFTDISSIDYEPTEHQNVSYTQAMGRLHAVKRDGTVLTGLEVFKTVYRAIGLEWFYQLMNIPVVGAAVQQAYDMFAEHRLRLTGRGDLADVIREREAELEAKAKEGPCEDTCHVDW
mmetsp:Transcript_1913/g.3392  ORF Transcript_1913/g.3392 Transcript_1913/m.3392 type:complete len:251 (+) Transcript_1913:622-1374(+)|eukprot:CAMPEP_0184706246 /NCGR_PEP_ID=MMETSP0313-20130426/36660_1 /TAXON_ID=2792 /ORGANISM="Porphyridium aerugineum, Strain SAG 1380-2" /LENGTH=250 /DNA_ID=CAMNT_0027167795 /DNA_START=993 /DNA_END=1745 /DNA_ORIENTATION=-